MKLKKALVFSADFDNIAPLCSGANLLAKESVAAVLSCRECAESLLTKADKVAWLGGKAEGSMAEDYTVVLEALIRKEGVDLVLFSGMYFSVFQRYTCRFRCSDSLHQSLSACTSMISGSLHAHIIKASRQINRFRPRFR